jgi:predicted alpha/beta superfamily hydrolase
LAPKEHLPFYSSVLKENRTIEIITPSEFVERQSADYDIIYVLDGIRALHFVAWDYLKGEGFIPKNTILVGLLGLKDTHTRLRDFTPTSTSADSGGATGKEIPTFPLPCSHLLAFCIIMLDTQICLISLLG